MRLAASAIVLALAFPVWASEMQMKEKKDPKAEQQKQDAPQPKKQDPAKDATKQDAEKKKKNCPIDVMSFNTLEDMFGFAGTVDALTLHQQQQAEQAKTQAVEGKTAAAAVEWRTVAEPEKKGDKAEEKKGE
jgi:hypothetical protein